MKVSVKKVILPFKIPATTSRGAYDNREIYLVSIQKDGFTATGECAPLIGLSIDYKEDLEQELSTFCMEINESQELDPYKYKKNPAFIFALESALRQIELRQSHLLYSTPFSKEKQGIPIN